MVNGSRDGKSVLKLKKCRNSAASASRVDVLVYLVWRERGEKDIHLTGGGEPIALALTALV